jgi:hypothetical protein
MKSDKEMHASFFDRREIGVTRSCARNIFANQGRWGEK